MKIQRLKLEGFMSYRNPVEVDFSKLNLFLISGPVGAGKSSLLDAITFAIYGQTPRFTRSREGLINRASERAKVDLEFTLNNRRYVLSRIESRSRAKKEITKASLEVYENGKLVERKTRTSEVNDYLRNEVFKVDFKTFNRSVIIPQGEFKELLQLSRKENREIFAGLFGLDIYDKVYELLRDRVSALRGELSALEGRLSALKAEVDAIPKDEIESALEEREKRIELLRAITSLQDILTKLPIEKFINLTERALSPDLRGSYIHPLLLWLFEIVAELSQKFGNLIYQLDSALFRDLEELFKLREKERTISKEIIDLEDQLRTLMTDSFKYEELSKEEELLSSLLDGIRSLESPLSDLRGRLRDLEDTLSDISALRDELATDLSALLRGEILPVINHRFPLDDILEADLSKFLRFSSDLMEWLNDSSNQLLGVSGTFEKLSAQLSASSDRYAKLLEGISSFSKLRDEEEKKLKLIGGYEADPISDETTLSKLEKLLRLLGSFKEKVDLARAEVEEVRAKIQNLTSKLKQLNSMRESLEEQQEKLLTERASLEGSLEELSEKLTVIDKAIDIASSLRPNEICPVCGNVFLRSPISQSHHSSIRKRLKALEDKLKKVTSMLEENQIELNTYKREIESLKEERESLKRKVEEIRKRLLLSISEILSLLESIPLEGSLEPLRELSSYLKSSERKMRKQFLSSLSNLNSWLEENYSNFDNLYKRGLEMIYLKREAENELARIRKDLKTIRDEIEENSRWLSNHLNSLSEILSYIQASLSSTEIIKVLEEVRVEVKPLITSLIKTSEEFQENLEELEKLLNSEVLLKGLEYSSLDEEYESKLLYNWELLKSLQDSLSRVMEVIENTSHLFKSILVSENLERFRAGVYALEEFSQRLREVRLTLRGKLEEFRTKLLQIKETLEELITSSSRDQYIAISERASAILDILNSLTGEAYSSANNSPGDEDITLFNLVISELEKLLTSEELEELGKLLEALREDIERWKDKRRTLELKLSSLRDEYQSLLQEYEGLWAKIKSELADTSGRVKGIYQLLNDLLESISSSQEELEFMRKTQTMDHEIISQVAEFASSLKAIRDILTSIRDTLSRLASSFEEGSERFSSSLEPLLERLVDLRKELERSLNDFGIPATSEDISNFRDFLKVLEEREGIITSLYEVLNLELFKNSENPIEDLGVSGADLDTSFKETAELVKSSLANFQSLIQDLRDFKVKLNSYMAIGDLGKKLLRYMWFSQEDLELLERVGKTMASLRGALERLRDETEDINKTKEELLKEISDLKSKLQRYKLYEGELEKVQAQINRKLKEIDLFSSLLKDFRDNKLKNFVLNFLLMELFDRANEILLELTDGRYELIVDDSGTKVKDHWLGGAIRDMSGLSGGETFLASLSLALALGVQLTKGKVKLDTMFIDEGFGSLDADSLNLVVNVLRNMAERGKIIGIVSHVERLNDWFDQKIEVIKSSDGSKVKVVV